MPRRYNQRYGRWDDYVAGRPTAGPQPIQIAPQGVNPGSGQAVMGPNGPAFEEAMKRAQIAQALQQQQRAAITGQPNGVNPTPGAGQAVQGPGGPQYDAAMKSAQKAQAQQAQTAAATQKASQGLMGLGSNLMGSSSQKKAEEEAKRKALLNMAMSSINSQPGIDSIKVGF